MKFRPNIAIGDFNTKSRKILEFLRAGHKVKITVMFRGREVQRPEFGTKLLENLVTLTTGLARVEGQPNLKGRNLTMVLAPKR